MAFFIKCGMCGQLFDPKGEPPKMVQSSKEEEGETMEICGPCYEKVRDGRDDLYHLLGRK